MRRFSLSNHLVSLLHYASICGWEGTIDLLLDHGADPRQTCMTGETALHFAVALKHGEAAETLLKRSQDLVNEADKVIMCCHTENMHYEVYGVPQFLNMLLY